MKAGHERYESLTAQFLRGTRCVILVYDITVRKSFDKLQDYITMFKNENVRTEMIIFDVLEGRP